MMRLDRFLSNNNCGSRKEVKESLKKGFVKVNDLVVKDGSIKIKENEDDITYGNNKIEYKPYLYIMLNKPAGYISASRDNVEKTVIDLIKDYTTNDLFPVGRLDKDTVGLLIISNDGKLAHELLSPKKHVEKTYYVELINDLTDVEIQLLESGITIDTNYTCLPAKIEVIDATKINITIYEGKYHQIKKMMVAIGNKVLYLKRIKMNELQLDTTLKEGEYRELTANELERLKFK